MKDGADPLRALRRAACLEGDAAERIPLGAPVLDAALGGGLARGEVHEIFARAEGDAMAAAGFAAMLAARLPGGVLWLREARAARAVPYPPGLAAIGLDPGRLILATLPDLTALLRAAVDGARCAGLGVVVAATRGNPRALDLTATRRLALAAERSGVTVLLARVAAEEGPSAARIRWRVAAAASTPMAAMAPGLPALRLELTRRRGGPATGPWTMEWDNAERSLRPFGEPPFREDFPGVLPPAGDGPALYGPLSAAPLAGSSAAERRSA